VEILNRTAARPNRDFAIGHDLMSYINDTIPAAIENAVQELVDHELTTMIRGESFKKRVQNLIDARLQSLVSKIAIKTSRCLGYQFPCIPLCPMVRRCLTAEDAMRYANTEKTIFPGEHLFGFDVPRKKLCFWGTWTWA